MSWYSNYPYVPYEDSPSQFIVMDKNGYGPSHPDSRGGQRLPPFFPSPSSSSSGSASSYHNLIPPTAVPPGFYFKHTEGRLPHSQMWHFGRYREDELPNMSSDMAAAMYPQIQRTAHGRRFSVAELPPSSSSSSSSSSSRHGQPPHFNDRRRVSVSRFQDIPASKFLAVPSFHDYRQRQQAPQISDLTVHKGKQRNKYRRQSEDMSSKAAKRSPPAAKESSGSQSSLTDKSDTPILHRRRDRSRTPDPTASAPAFEFTSSHLPLRPPSISVNKLSSGASGSNSTPESQRIESRHMIRPGTGQHKVKSALADSKIWSITKPGRICTHGGLKTCKDCNLKVETGSHCSSVGPPPTFTALDTYAPVRRKRTSSCSCGVAFRVSVILFVLVMLFITAFIVYSEMVLKHQTDTVMDKM